MNQDTLFFFRDHTEALPLYLFLEEKMLSGIPDVKIKVSKSQIGFRNKRGFAYVSFLPVRKAKERPRHYITVTFGLGYQKESARIDASVEPYPNRWTHHVMVTKIQEIDEELLCWIREAADFSAAKR